MKLIFFLSLFLVGSYAETVDPNTNCISGITTALESFTFNGTYDGYYANLCNNTLGVRSLWANAKTYCNADEIAAGAVLFGSYCELYGSTELIPYDDVKSELTEEYIQNLTVVNFVDIDATATWNTSLLLSKQFYDEAIHTVIAFDDSMILHQNLGWVTYGFWGAILVLGMTYNLFNWLFYNRLASTTRDVEGRTAKSAGWMRTFATPNHWLRKDLLIPSSIGSYHQRLFRGFTIPTRVESLAVYTYWALSIILCAIHYDVFDHNLYYTKHQQVLRYLADRTGIIAYANLPVMWMFSGRNNVFLWATGWSFGTFNLFHRHVARIATVQAIVHSILYSLLEAQYPGEYEESWTENYWYMGGLATIVMSLLLVLSSVWLRAKAYEVFLIIHIVLSVATIVGLFYHTAIFDGSYDPYLWPLVAIWCFDRFARIVRQICCNVHVKLSNGIQTTSSTATYDAATNMITVDITPGSSFLKPKPNQHYFLYQPLRWRGWENHPFSLASWTDSSAHRSSSSLPRIDLSDTKNESTVKTGPVSESSTHSSIIADGKTDGRYTLRFFIRPFSGWTTKLRDQCLKAPNNTCNPRLLIEGPYGHSTPLHLYENILFIVGGSGVGGATSYIQDHISRSKSETGTRTTDITLLWASKQSAMIRDIVSRDLSSALARPEISASFYATREKSQGAAITKEEKEADATGEIVQGGLEINYGRPDVKAAIDAIVANRAGAGCEKAGRIAVFVCGPAAMADDARSGVHDVLKRGVRGVEYLEETFGW